VDGSTTESATPSTSPTQTPNDPQRAARLVQLAKRWHRRYVGIEWSNFFVIGTIALAMLVALGCAALVVLTLLRIGIDAFDHTWVEDLLPEANWTNAAFGGAMLVLAAGGRTFLSEYLGDVQFWTTYEDTSTKNRKRREILDACTDTLRHVLADAKCDRVVIVAHSLGTTVALDSILALARENRANHPDDESKGTMGLEKISHFVTMGSPIDKVHYFFESNAGSYHRYNRVVEELRGDIGTWPFAWNAKARVRWINFWDRADIISDALFTPTNRAYDTISVDNVETNNLTWPDPAGAHLAYFENAQVIETVFRATFDASFEWPARRGLEPTKDATRDAVLASQESRASTNFFHWMLVWLPWLVIGGAIAVKRGVFPPSLAAAALAPLAIVFLVRVAARPARPIDFETDEPRPAPKAEAEGANAVAPEAVEGDDEEAA
jgi:hypothetical protein